MSDVFALASFFGRLRILTVSFEGRDRFQAALAVAIGPEIVGLSATYRTWGGP
jgi:hypothetical protein